MVDPEIKTGDVVHDLVERGKMQVVAKAANSVTEYRESESFDLAEYKSHPLLGVTEDDPVYTCVYLPDSPTTSFSGTYDFPRSRLARVPVEEANEDLQRFQGRLITAVLSALAEEALTSDVGNQGPPESFEAALLHCWPDEKRDTLVDAFSIAKANIESRGDA